VIVLLIATRDEAPLLQLNLNHHLEWGVDHVAVADNASMDETRDVVAGYGDAVTSLVFGGDGSRRMPALVEAFRRVEERFGAVDWAGVSDTDEFWWAPGTDLKAIFEEIPQGTLGVNFDQKLFVPTELDGTEGPVYCRRVFRTSGPASPLHTSYSEGKSFYRGSWVRERGLLPIHWCEDIPHPRPRFEQPRVHHYMVDGEDGFVRKVKRLKELWPWIGAEKTRLGDFKLAWWQLYQAEGEGGLREYYRSRYLVKAAEIPGDLENGILVSDPTFADFKQRSA
jgi:hypothetical protein